MIHIVWSEGKWTIRQIADILKHDFKLEEVIVIKKISKARWQYGLIVPMEGDR